MADHAPSLLNRWIELSITAGSKATVLSGKVVQVDRKTLTIMCPRQDRFRSLKGEAVTAFVLVEGQVETEFATSIIQHSVDTTQQAEAFVLVYPDSFQRRGHRSADRLETKMPAKVSIIYVDDELMPLEVRRRQLSVIIADISENGARMMSNILFPERAQLVLRFCLRSEEFHPMAAIAWSRAVSDYYTYGLEFVKPDRGMQQTIREIHLSQAFRQA